MLTPSNLIPIAASTLWERCEHVADCLLPVFLLLQKKAAEAVKDAQKKANELMRPYAETTSLKLP